MEFLAMHDLFLAFSFYIVQHMSEAGLASHGVALIERNIRICPDLRNPLPFEPPSECVYSPGMSYLLAMHSIFLGYAFNTTWLCIQYDLVMYSMRLGHACNTTWSCIQYYLASTRAERVRSLFRSMHCEQHLETSSIKRPIRSIFKLSNFCCWWKAINWITTNNTSSKCL